MIIIHFDSCKLYISPFQTSFDFNQHKNKPNLKDLIDQTGFGLHTYQQKPALIILIGEHLQ